MRLEITAVGDTIWCVLDDHPQYSSWRQHFIACLRETTRGNSRLKEAQAIKNKHLPKRIYKYRKCSSLYHLDTLKSDTVWLCSPKHYNDPYDCWFTLPDGLIATHLERALKKRHHTHPYAQVAADKFAPKLAAKLANYRNHAKICSFSSRNDSILMWSHYSEDHTGFCIEYDISELRPDDSFCKNLYPVIYSNDLRNLGDFVERLIGRANDEGYPEEGPLLCMLIKFNGWEYENEWRIIRKTSRKENDGPMLAPLASRVFVGAQFDCSKNQNLIAICKEKEIRIERMRLANDEFKLITD
jgi:hypothetical protein